MNAVLNALLSFLLAAPGQAAAQTSAVVGTIRGTVIDARTGVPLSGVLVRVPESGVETATNAEGRFLLARVPAGKRLVYVTLVGFGLSRREVTVANGETVELAIPLAEGTGAYVETITVTPGDATSPLDRRGGDPLVPSHQTLGLAELQDLRGVLADDAFRAAQTLPGVATGDDFRSEFSVRGGSFRSLGVSIDGLFSPLLLHTVRAVNDTGSVAMINSDLLERVTLENGAYAQTFGQRTGAHLDFAVREGSRDRTLTRGAVSGTSAAFLAEGPIGRSRRGSWIASVRKSYLDWLIDRIEPDAPGRFGFADAQAKAVFDLTPRHQVQALLIAGRSHASEREDTDGTSVNSFHDGFHRAAGGQLAWRSLFGQVVATQRVSFVGGRYWNLTDTGLDSVRGRDRSLTWRGDAIWSASPRLRVDLGGHVERRRADLVSSIYQAGSTLASPRVRQRFAVDGDGLLTGGWVRAQMTFGPLTLAPGARIDRFDPVSTRQRSVSSPWLQAEWRAASRIRVHAAGGLYHQYPDFEQLATLQPPAGLGDVAPRPERARHADAAIELRLDDRTRLDVAAYHRGERDMLRTVGQEFRVERGILIAPIDRIAFGQSLSGEASGIELTLERRDPNRLSGWIAYSYGETRYRDVYTGESFWGDFDQRHTLNAYGHYRVSNRTSFSGKFRFGSNFPVTGYFEQRAATYYVAESRNEIRLPAYARVDLRVNRTFNYARRRLTLFVEVLNVTARTNYRASRGRVDRRTRVATGITQTLFPIVPSTGLLIEF
ncbi:MAG: TonB-dependent receptor [Acidimicrobiia bacterium]|nr:TonB-dependent receptor [Acidimicrobiia bacterium]